MNGSEEPHNEEAFEEASSFWPTLKALSPYLLLCALCTVVVTFGASWAMSRWGTSFVGAPAQVVTFDVFKYVNAQRAVAEEFIKPTSSSSLTASQILSDMPAKTRVAIAKVAGPNTLVVIKQAVVQGQARDITNQVLRLLSLPTNVPSTISGASLGGGIPVIKLQMAGSDGAEPHNQLP
jgi:hypothetical protein